MDDSCDDVVTGTASRVYSMPWKHINGNVSIKKAIQSNNKN